MAEAVTPTKKVDDNRSKRCRSRDILAKLDLNTKFRHILPKPIVPDGSENPSRKRFLPEFLSKNQGADHTANKIGQQNSKVSCLNIVLLFILKIGDWQWAQFCYIATFAWIRYRTFFKVGNILILDNFLMCKFLV